MALVIVFYRYYLAIAIAYFSTMENHSISCGYSINPINQGKSLSESTSSNVKFQNQLMAFTNTTLIDGTGNAIKANQTIIIENGLFKTIGNSDAIEIPDLATAINLHGKTIIPGIVGMHNHLHIPRFPDVGDVAAKLYLASGVTTIQTCGAVLPNKELELSKRIASGIQVGPDVIPSAPFITGKGGNPNMIIPRNSDHLRDTLQHWINKGVKWFKVYRDIKPDDLKIIIEEAHKYNAKIRGHLCSVTFEEATNLGIDGIEHGLNSTSDFRTSKAYGVCNGGREYMDELDMNGLEVTRLQQLMVERNVFLTSTLSIYEASVPRRAFADVRSLKAMSPNLRNQYLERRKNFDMQPNGHQREKRLQRIMQFEYQYYKKGGLLCAGVDAGRHVLPGFGDQRNYELLVEAGFTTEEAIQVMTSNGAKALGRTDIGLIQKGKRADFVILNGNLELNPSLIKQVEAVYKNGVEYNSQELLSEVEGKFPETENFTND